MTPPFSTISHRWRDDGKPNEMRPILAMDNSVQRLMVAIHG